MTTNEITPPNTQSGWSRFYQKFISAHPSVLQQEERYKAELLSALSLAFSIIILGGSLATILFTGFTPLIVAGALFGVASFATYIMSRGQLYKRAPLLFISSFALLAYTASLIGDYPALFLVLTFAILFLLSNLLELKELIWAIAINTTLALLISTFMQLEGQEALNARAGVFSIGLFVILFAWYRENLERLRLEEIDKSRKEAENLNTELQQTSQYLELAIEVSQKVSVVQDVDLMLAEAANIIRDSFDMYYTQIYLTDRFERNLILRAGTGQVGEKLLNRAHRLSIDMSSINGTVATQRRAVIVEDTETSRIHRPNPLLPDTRSEMAVPLMAQDRVVGVLDLQSAEAGALNEENLSAFEALAGQLAIAIVNAELFAEVEEARAQIETRSAQATKEGWKDYLDAIERKDRIAYSYENENITPLVEAPPPASDEKTLVVPIDVAGAEIGALQFEGKQAWDKSDAIFASVIAEQVALQVENIRLLEQSQQYQNEAQEALRRLTREAWEGYQKEESLAYIYKDAQVQALEDDPFEEKESYEIKISNETIGQINIARHETLSAEDAELAASITEQLSAHLENLRLSKETERALAETESALEQVQRLGSAVEQSVDGMAIADMQGNIEFTNRAWAEMHGYEGNELIGKPMTLFHTKEQLEKEVAPFNDAVAKKGVSQGEVGHKRKDGSTFPTWMTVTVMMSDVGAPIALVASAQDITERKKAEQLIQESQERAQTILESITLPMVITRLSDNIYTFVNQPAADTVGTPLDQMINRPALDFYADPKEREKFVEDLRANGFVNNMQVLLKRSNGSTFWSLLSARIFSYEGEPSILATITDISDRIAAQEATAKRAAELATVAEVSTAAARALNIDELLQEVVDLTRKGFDLYHAHIYLLDEAKENLKIQACGWEEGSPHIGSTHGGNPIIPLVTEKSIVVQATRNRQAVIVNDTLNDPNWLPNEMMPDTRSEMAIPLIVGDELIGVFDIQSNEIDHFTDEDVSIQTTLASQVAVALQNARSFEEAKEQAEQESTINIISQRIQGTTSVEDALQVAVRELGRALGAKQASIQLNVGSKGTS